MLWSYTTVKTDISDHLHIWLSAFIFLFIVYLMLGYLVYDAIAVRFENNFNTKQFLEKHLQNLRHTHFFKFQYNLKYSMFTYNFNFLL